MGKKCAGIFGVDMSRIGDAVKLKPELGVSDKFARNVWQITQVNNEAQAIAECRRWCRPRWSVHQWASADVNELAKRPARPPESVSLGMTLWRPAA